ncbi:hypothetical protein CISIN_1g0456192mg, partial [Citrus sinensis]
KTK